MKLLIMNTLDPNLSFGLNLSRPYIKLLALLDILAVKTGLFYMIFYL